MAPILHFRRPPRKDFLLCVLKESLRSSSTNGDSGLEGWKYADRRSYEEAVLLHDMLDVDECSVGVGGRSLMKRLSRYAGRVPTCDGRGKDMVILFDGRVEKSCPYW